MGVDARFTEETLPVVHQPACYLRELHPAHDVTANGRKISGNAQYRRKDAVIQHGSLKFAMDPERHLSTFAAPDTTPEEFRERVTTVREQTRSSDAEIDREECVRAVEEALAAWADADEGSWSDAELAAARDHAEAKFSSESWTRYRDDPTP
jgi:lipoate-protein ligase A